jgi:hypothetical protein
LSLKVRGASKLQQQTGAQVISYNIFRNKIRGTSITCVSKFQRQTGAQVISCNILLIHAIIFSEICLGTQVILAPLNFNDKLDLTPTKARKKCIRIKKNLEAQILFSSLTLYEIFRGP